MSEDTSNEVVEETVEVAPETTIEEPSSEQVESPELEAPLLAGKYKSAEELEKAYSEAQRLISEQGARLKEADKPQLEPDKQQLLDELKALGVVTTSDLQQQNAVQSQAQKDNLEITGLGISDAQVAILRSYAGSKDNLSKSMTDCWNELQGVSGGKVVSRKTTIKPKPGNKTGFVEKTLVELKKLSQDDYNKYWADYANHKAGI